MFADRISFSEEEVRKGMWWRPSDEQNQIFGELKYDKNLGISLEIHGTSFRVDSDNSVQFINGILDNGTKITLWDCALSNFNVGAKYPKYKFRCKMILSGDFFSSEEELFFDDMILEPDQFIYWMGQAELETKKMTRENKTQGLQVNLKLMDELSFNIDEEKTIKLFSQFSYEGNARGQFTLNRYGFFEVAYQNKLPLRDLLEFSTRISWLLSLLVNVPIRFETINMKSGNKSIYVLFRQIVGKEEDARPHYMIPFSTIKDDLKNIVTNWFKLYSTCPDVCNLFFANFFSSNLFVENEFTNLSQALEVYHRERIKGYIATSEQKKELLTCIKDALTPLSNNPLTNKVIGMLGQCHEPGYKERILNLINGLPKELKDTYFLDPDLYSKRIRDLRNHLTHYSSGKEYNPIIKSSLVGHMEMVLSFYLLKEVSIRENLIIDFLDLRYKWLQRYPISD